MLRKISLFAAIAALPLVLTGCGGDDADTTTTPNTLGQDVKFGANSTDLGTAPYFFIGTQTITGFDGEFAGVPSPVTTPSPTTASLAKVTLTLTGEIVGASGNRPEFYQLTISFLNTNGATPVGPIAPPFTNATVYKVGIAKDTNNDVYCFSPTTAGPVNKVGATSMEVFVDSQVSTISGPIKDFTVNIPTVAGTTLAPFTGTINTSAQSFLKLVVDNGTLANGGTTQATTTVVPTAKFEVTIPWLAPIKAAVTTPVVPATVPPSSIITTTQVDQTAYWKAGIGLVESVCRVNWVVTGASPTPPAPGAAPSQIADFAINPLLLNSIDNATKYNFGVVETGFVNPTVAPMPRGTN